MSVSDATTQPVTVGFVPLIDAALLVVAREEGFAAAWEIDLRLVREGSWAAVRDKLNVGVFDAAHMLCPAAIASTLGIGHVESPLASPIALNLDGNAITISIPLAERLTALLGRAPDQATPPDTAAALATIVAEHRAAGRKPITAGVVFGFSNHVHQVSAWLRQGGLAPGRDVPMVVIPPPLMVDSIRAGHIDIFCAGAPWNVMADAAGAGRVLHPCAAMLPHMLEKLLVVRAQNASAPWLVPLTRALIDAAHWANDPANRRILARHLARPDYVGVPVHVIERLLSGEVPTLFSGAAPSSGQPWISFDPEALRPNDDRLRTIFDLMALDDQVSPTPEAWARTRAILRPDVHAAASRLRGPSR